MVDRPALTLRTLAVAALGVLLLAPEAVVHPSFQMSFAATLALVAGYERGLPWMVAGADTLARRARRAVGRARDRRADPGLAARRARDHALRGLSLPSPGALWRDREPAGDAGRVGLGDADGIAWRCRAAVRLRCAAVAADGARHRLDDRGRALGREPAGRGRPHGGVRDRAAAAGQRRAWWCLCLLRSPLRWSGAVAGRRRGALGGADAAAGRAGRGPTATSSRCAAPPAALGHAHAGSDTFAVREWLAADADARTAADATLRDGMTCDEIGCVARLADGTDRRAAVRSGSLRGGLPPGRAGRRASAPRRHPARRW